MYVQDKQYLKFKRRPFLPEERLEDWDKETVKKAISSLNRTSPLKSLRSMRVNREPTADPVLSQFVGHPCSRKFIHQAAIHFFGSWNAALKACGLEPIRSSHNRFWSKTLIVDCLKALDNDGHPLTVLSIWRDRSRKTTRVLLATSGKATTGSALHDAARRFFGSWDNALSAAGLSVELIKEKPFWTKKKIITSLQLLDKNGVPSVRKQVVLDTHLQRQALRALAPDDLHPRSSCLAVSRV